MTQPPIEQYDVGSPKQPADEDAHVDPWRLNYYQHPRNESSAIQMHAMLE